MPTIRDGKMCVWDEARRELDCWSNTGLKARFWVRDDDAFETSENLTRLRNIATKYKIRVGLAIIPGKLVPSLSEFLADNVQQFYPMCHGWKHINHNRKNRPAEFGPDRPLSSMIADAEFALHQFKEIFDTSQPIFVPPFNRITSGLIKALPAIGFSGVSLMPNYFERKMLQLGSRIGWSAGIKVPHFTEAARIDVHLDIIDWGARTAQEAGTTAAQLVQNLRGRRLGLLATDAPIGLLTHHLAHNEEIWWACENVLEFLGSHEAVEFVDVGRWADEHATTSRKAVS